MINVAVTLKLIAKKDLAKVFVDSTVQQKAVAHPTDSKPLEKARAKLVVAAKQAGLEVKQTYAKEGQCLLQGTRPVVMPMRVSSSAHAPCAPLKRQRTIVGRLQREITRKLSAVGQAVSDALGTTLAKARQIWEQTSGQKVKSDRAGSTVGASPWCSASTMSRASTSAKSRTAEWTTTPYRVNRTNGCMHC